MNADRRWYAEPQTFIALAALIVSVSAVVVGLYEASLQRHHDRAEVWPHVEIQVFTKQTGAAIALENTGIGPAIIQSVVVTVDGRPQASWRDVLRTLNGVQPVGFGNYSAVQHGLRPGERLTLLDLPVADLPANFWKSIARVGVRVCYASVFDEHWIVESKKLGDGPISWADIARCPPQADSADF
ncbi:MAG: hypothetical protein ACJ79Q_09995 [Gemmatimonadaceae bacterium]|jgi:hypothetical protein